MYELYNPTILKIETIKLEKRLDHDLSYLQDALPEFSTFDFNLEPISHPSGSPVPINDIKVKLRPPPWRARWELCGYKGIEDAWTEVSVGERSLSCAHVRQPLSSNGSSP